MKKFILSILLLIGSFTLTAQQLLTRNGYIGFFSKTPLEDIKAETTQANAVLDASKQTLAFAVLLKGFLFPKALMQEHFNENYVESDKFPKATFSGAYSGSLDLKRPGTYNVMVKGQLTLHGATKPIEMPAVFQVNENNVTGKAAFVLTPQDFEIQVPSLVRDKIARQISVSVNVEFPILK